MKVGLAQINTVVGDLEGNAAKVAETYARLVAEGAELVVFSGTGHHGLPAARFAL